MIYTFIFCNHIKSWVNQHEGISPNSSQTISSNQSMLVGNIANLNDFEDALENYRIDDIDEAMDIDEDIRLPGNQVITFFEYAENTVNNFFEYFNNMNVIEIIDLIMLIFIVHRGIDIILYYIF